MGSYVVPTWHENRGDEKDPFAREKCFSALRNTAAAWSKRLVMFGKSLIFQYFYWRIRYMPIGELDSTGLQEGASVFLPVLEIDKNCGYLAFLAFCFSLSLGLVFERAKEGQS